MNYLQKYTLACLLACIHLATFAQPTQPEGYFTSEAKVLAADSRVIVSVKKFNPTEADIQNAIKPPKNGPWNYLMLPYGTNKVLLNNKGFESKLYALNKVGEVVWEYTLGYSDKSQASPVVINHNFIFAGESEAEDNKIAIQKIDYNGNVIWKKELDSLDNVDDIIVSGDMVCALVSFDYYQKVVYPDNTYGNKMFPVYFYVQLNIETGEIIKKEYQKMGVYLSGKHFSNPVFNTAYSYYLSNTDSAAFISTLELDKARIVSDKLVEGSKIKQISVGPDYYHLLYTKAKSRNKNTYALYTDYYGTQKIYDVDIPLEPTSTDRIFMTPASPDSLFIIIGQPEKITILLVDHDGNTSIYKQIDEVLSPLLFAGYAEGKVVLVQVVGREKVGTPGELVVGYY